MVHVTPLVFSPQDVYSLVRVEPAGFLRVVLGDKAGKGLPHDQAHVQRQARLWAR